MTTQTLRRWKRLGLIGAMTLPSGWQHYCLPDVEAIERGETPEPEPP